MKIYKIMLLLFMVPLFVLSGFKEKRKTKIPAADKWTGTVTRVVTSKSKARTVVNNILGDDINNWDHFFAFHNEVNFVNSKGMVIRTDTTINWDKDSLSTGPKGIPPYLVEERTTKVFGNGKGSSDLEIQFSGDKKTYWINFEAPRSMEYTSHSIKSDIVGNSSDTSSGLVDGLSLTLPPTFTGHPVGNDPNVLSGTFEEILPAPNDPGGGAIITRAKWNLKRVH
jgi:hypothetical protein